MLKQKIGLRFLWITVLVIVIDYFSKTWMLQHLHPHEPWIITAFFNFNLTFNTGASFGFLHHASGWQWYFFTLLSSSASIGLCIWLWLIKPNEWPLAIALNCILGGAIGNLIDRVRYGVVVDFLQFHWEDWSFAIFNIADMAISLGAFMMILHWWLDSAAVKNR